MRLVQAHLLPYEESITLHITEATELRALGLDSLKQVQLLVELEHQYGVELPDSELNIRIFRTPASLWAVLAELLAPADASDFGSLGELGTATPPDGLPR